MATRTWNSAKSYTFQNRKRYEQSVIESMGKSYMGIRQKVSKPQAVRTNKFISHGVTEFKRAEKFRRATPQKIF